MCRTSTPCYRLYGWRTIVRVKLRVIDGCACPASVAPYVYLVVRRARQTASSIYRGEDAKAVLHRHGKRTQAEIHRDMPLISNPAGRSTHELRSDGVAWPGPVGRKLEEWQVGVDSGGDDHDSKMAINAAATHYGWATFHPYARGVEGHHWGFKHQPRAKGVKQRAMIIATRAKLAIR